MNTFVQQGGKYLTCYLAEEEYAIPILKVQEIIGLVDITPVPNTSMHVLGVINLRGKIIPVVDLSSKLGMMSAESSRETCIIVIETEKNPIGVVVDRVAEVADIPQDHVEPPPDMGPGVDTEYFTGVGKVEGRVQLLLNIERVVGGDAGASAMF